MEKLINEVKGMLEVFGYKNITCSETDIAYCFNFRTGEGNGPMRTRHKDAITMLLKGYLIATASYGSENVIQVGKTVEGLDPDDDRYNRLLCNMITVKDNKRTEEEVKGKEMFINMYDRFDRIFLDNEVAESNFLNAIEEWNSRSEKTKQNEALTAEFSRVTDDMIELYSRKNLDYGNSFGRTYQELGIISAVTRINDKVERLKRLATHPDTQQVHDESIDDTLTDLACYAVMTLMERRREKGGEAL